MNIEIIGKNCCGCRSCEQICPKKSITMKENDEGFIYPVIDKNTCINCGLCLLKCPIHSYKNNDKIPEAYAFVSKNGNIRFSASGGFCDLVSRKIIMNDGVVYGVAFNDDFEAVYERVTNIEGLKKIQSSKYVFADTLDSYSKVKRDLNNNKYVLFIGTSCQVSGLITFLGRDFDNLLTISLICHGVPSPKLFKGYLMYMEKKLKSKILKYDFRSKEKYGWGLYEKITCKNKSYYSISSFTPYGYDFLNGYNYRENCYECKYCNINRIGDISVGDFWGVNEKYPDIYSKDGVSAILIMTEKGKKTLLSIEKEAIIKKISIDDVLMHQENLKHPTARNEIRDIYYKNFMNNPNFFQCRRPKKPLKYYLSKICPKTIKKMVKFIFR